MTDKKPSASELLARIKAAKDAKPEEKPAPKKTGQQTAEDAIRAAANRGRSPVQKSLKEQADAFFGHIEWARDKYEKVEGWLCRRFDQAKRIYETGKYVHKYINYFPLFWPFTKPLEYGWNAYKAGFTRVSYTKDENGERNVLSPKRAAAAVLVSLPLLYGAYGGYSWYYSNLGGVAYDAVAINYAPIGKLITTGHTDWGPKRGVFIFGAADEVEGHPDIYKAPACVQSPCEGQENTVQFRIRDSAYLDLTRLVGSLFKGDFSNTDFGEFFDPAELAGTFLSGKNVCYVEFFGTRHKTFGWYPYIMNATCEDVQDGNIDQALKNMRDKYIPAGYEMDIPN
ncbi:MAG: hypothetical protein LRY54_04950 [Alphaproteobacteria bacterium]|nr:hypothetical protein [Alphaproteobacteria bacterium]